MPREHKKEGDEVDKDRRKVVIFAGLAVVAGMVGYLRLLTSTLLQRERKETEAFKKMLREIQKFLSDFYQANKPVTFEESVKNTRELSKNLLAIAENNGISVREGKSAQARIIQIFQENGYVFAPSPLALEGGAYVINAPLYRIGSTREFDLSELKFEGLPSSTKKVLFLSVEKTVVPDMRETQFFAGPHIEFDGMTISNSKTGDSDVLIFPDKIQSVAEKEGLDPAGYRKTVEINEMAQVYFSEIIPNNALGLPLSEFGIDTRGHRWTLHHVQEAFSDFASLKFGKTLRHELIRILTATNYSYDFTKTIAIDSVNLGLKKTGSGLQLTPHNAKEIVQNLKDKDFDKIKQVVMSSYELNIKAILSEILKKIKK